jgi:hypothetical protein
MILIFESVEPKTKSVEVLAFVMQRRGLGISEITERTLPDYSSKTLT